MSEPSKNDAAPTELPDTELPDTELPDTELGDSNPNAGGPDGLAGGMGVSSERVGDTGPGQVSTDGTRDTSVGRPDDQETPPEQSPGNAEDNPEGLAPKAGYSTLDPRSD